MTENESNVTIDPTTGAAELDFNAPAANPAEGQAPAPEAPPRKSLSINKEEGAPAERPAWLPAKFKNAEDMAKAYGELERKQGSGQPPKAPETPPAPKAGEGQPPKTPETPPAPSLTPLTKTEFEGFSNELISQGQLSDASYQALEKRGLTRDVVDAYVAGQEAIRDRVMNEVLATAGGEEGYQALTGWAAENLSAEELAHYNAEVESGVPARVKFAVKSLQAQHVAAVGRPAGRPATRFSGSRPGGGGGSGGVFASQAELLQAQRDPRYKHDPKYRQAVLDKAMRSDI